VGFFASRTSTSFPFIDSVGRFTASIVPESGRPTLSGLLHKEAGRYESAEFESSANGSPRLVSAVEWFDGTIVDRRRYGDHDLVVAMVDTSGFNGALSPLLYRHGGYGTFQPDRRSA
jgi:flavin reductase (DIM6/NTAB) family NADH-FMN oxidoreductase RutF